MPLNGDRMTATHERPLRHQGFTLLEVLVALLVMSIGLLGIGKMMMLAARANDSAYMRTQATALAYTILDAMRANRQAAIAQGYDTAVVAPALQACTVAAPCTSGQQAQNCKFHSEDRGHAATACSQVDRAAFSSRLSAHVASAIS